MRKHTDLFLGLFSLVAAIIMWLLPKTPIIVIISLVVIFLLLLYPTWNFWWIEKSLRRRFTALLLIASGLYAFGYFILPKDQSSGYAKRPVVFKPFATIYEIYKAPLGKPQGQAVKDSSVYYAVHEQAIVVWFKTLSRFYVLDQRNPKWTRQNDPTWETDPKWSNDKWLRKRFHPPENLGPPYSGVAKFWDRDKKNWSWIGWRKWHCFYISGDVYYQEFERGIIMGGFLLNPNQKEEAVEFVLTDDGQWSSRQSPTLKPPICTTTITTG
jgi:hypothetical protein